MKAATETMIVTSHGLNFGFQVSVINSSFRCAVIDRAYSTCGGHRQRLQALPHPHCRYHGHPRAQLIQSRLASVESDAHGQALHDLHVVAGRIFRRQHAVASAGGSWQTLDSSFELAAERVDADR